MADQISNFLENLKTDQALSEKVKGAKNVDEVVNIAKAEGHHITAEEFEKTFNSKDEVSIEDLENVAGGTHAAAKASACCGVDDSGREFNPKTDL